MAWLFLGSGSVGCINRLKHSLYGVFYSVHTPRMCLRAGLLDSQFLLPQKREMMKETCAHQRQILQNYFLTTSCLFVRCSRGWLWLFRLSFLCHFKVFLLFSPAFGTAAALGTGSWVQPGKAASLAAFWHVPAKGTASGQRAQVLSSSGSCSEQSMLYLLL